MDHTIIIKSAYTTLAIDNTRGSSRLATLTSNSGGTEPVEIDYTPNTGRVQINLLELTSKQRKELIRFLKQKD